MADECELTSYGQMIHVIEALPFLVREKRRERRLSMRQAAAETGLAASTFARLEGGKDVSVEGLIALLHWLNGGDER